MGMTWRTTLVIGLVLAWLAGPAGAADPVAKAEGETPDTRVELQELKRGSDGTLMLRMTLVNDSDKKLDIACSLRESGSESCGSISGVHLLDGAGKKKYLVLRDAGGTCVCSRGLRAVQAKSRINVWAKFPAPPADVQKVSVVVPTFIPMDDVPLR